MTSYFCKIDDDKFVCITQFSIFIYIRTTSAPYPTHGNDNWIEIKDLNDILTYEDLHCKRSSLTERVARKSS